jgi:hypothetical protein
MKTPCDESVIRSGRPGSPCARKSGPWILAATILASSMAFIDSTIVNVATPRLQSSFHVTGIEVQWVIESYGLFLASLILVGGALGDRLGRRLVFLIGVGSLPQLPRVVAWLQRFSYWCSRVPRKGLGRRFSFRAALRLSVHHSTKALVDGRLVRGRFYCDNDGHLISFKCQCVGNELIGRLCGLADSSCP